MGRKNDNKNKLVEAILKEYQPETAKDVQDALKDIFGPLFEAMLQGEMEIDVPRDRDGSFEPALVPKRTKDISDIDQKVISMYAKGMSQRDISATIENIYGFKMSHEMISNITDKVMDELIQWQNRPLKKCYPFIFVDCMYTTVRQDYESKEMATYTILGYDMDGGKEVL